MILKIEKKKVKIIFSFITKFLILFLSPLLVLSEEINANNIEETANTIVLGKATEIKSETKN